MVAEVKGLAAKNATAKAPGPKPAKPAARSIEDRAPPAKNATAGAKVPKLKPAEARSIFARDPAGPAPAKNATAAGKAPKAKPALVENEVSSPKNYKRMNLT